MQWGWVRHQQPLRVPTSGTKYLPLMGTQTCLTYPLSPPCSYLPTSCPETHTHTHAIPISQDTHMGTHKHTCIHHFPPLLHNTHTLLLQRFRWESSEENKCQWGSILQIWLFIMKEITGKCLDVKALLYLTLGCAVFWVYLDRRGRLLESILWSPSSAAQRVTEILIEVPLNSEELRLHFSFSH